MQVSLSAPLRISFVGGGTDMAWYYRRMAGAVFSTAISPRLHLTIEKINNNATIVVGALPETVEIADQLENSIIKTCLSYFNIKSGIKLTVSCAVKPGSGLATSSALCCACVAGLARLINGATLTPDEIAEIASIIEIEHANRKIGKQDHYGTAFGGTKLIQFKQNGSVQVTPFKGSLKLKNALQECMLVLDTSITRDASEVIKKQVPDDKAAYASNIERLTRIKGLVDEFQSQLLQGHFKQAGEVLLQSWNEKKFLSASLSSGKIDDAIQLSVSIGAYGAKLLGAGAGGHLLILAPKKLHDIIVKKTSLNPVDCQMTEEGIIFY